MQFRRTNFLFFLPCDLGFETVKLFSWLYNWLVLDMLINARIGLKHVCRHQLYQTRVTLGPRCAVLQALVLRHSSGHGHGLDHYDKKDYPKGLHPGTVDEIPLPKGDWQDKYNKKQKKYNMQLAVGMVLFAGSCYAVSEFIDFGLAPPMKNPKPLKPKIVQPEVPQHGASNVPVLPLKAPIEHFPESVPYLIVGGGAAASAAFRSIRSSDPKAKVLVITDEDKPPYMRPPLSKELWFSDPDLAKRLSFRQWNGSERDIFSEKDEFYCSLRDLPNRENGGVAIVKSHKVVKIDAKEQKAYVDSGQSINYEKCLLATGGSPKSLPVFDNASPDVKNKLIYYRTANDFLKLFEITKKAKSITIVGGGFLGSELACALGRRSSVLKLNLTLTQVYPEPGNIGKVLPEYLSKWATERVRAEG